MLAVAGIVLVSGALAVAFFWLAASSNNPDELAVRIAMSDDGFTRDAPRPVRAVQARTGNDLHAPLRCRWVYQHEDMGFVHVSQNGCEARFYFDESRTRLSRFALDRRMRVDVLVYSDERRVGFASTWIMYEGPL